ncbi:MAG: 3-oxoacid CoA-transferase subunit B [Clostridiales Family XIII bacterium]|jgi:acetate CoA/acetoacetate CoA-transferase beta subunit|nr:3-oxoacid CoA-transferase subunit B [Clostridiales Family XIII bacterium]
MALGMKDLMAMRAAEEMWDGAVVNLGFGIPQRIASFVSSELTIFTHAENGVLGAGARAEIGKEDKDLIDAGGEPITVIPGASFFDSADSFALIRSGKIDISFLGALEISETGDLANWMIPGGSIPGMGGAMDLARHAKKVIVLTTHTNKRGEPKLKKCCDLPLTATSCVSRIITDIAVIEVTPDGFLLTEMFDGHDVREVLEKTDAALKIADNIRIIQY